MMRSYLLAIAIALPLSLPVMAQQEPYLEEKRFIEYTEAISAYGDEWASSGCLRQADWFYGQAASAIASLRTAIAEIGLDLRDAAGKDAAAQALEDVRNMDQDDIDSINEVFGGGFDFLGMMEGLSSFTASMEKVNDKLDDLNENLSDRMEKWGFYVFKIENEMWWIVRDLCIASPWPDYFRGLVHDYRGEADDALKYYRRADANPYFPDFEFDFSFLDSLSYSELVALSQRLLPYQSRYQGSISEGLMHFDIDAPVWDDTVMRDMAQAVLDSKSPDYVKAQNYLEAAFAANPFKAENAYNCLAIYSFLENRYGAQKYLKQIKILDNAE